MGNSLAKLIRASRGPVLLMTLGVLLAIHQFTGLSFDQTFPILIIVFGMMWLLERMAPRSGSLDPRTAAYSGPVGMGQQPIPPQAAPQRPPFAEPEPSYDPLRDVHRRVYGTDVPPPATARPPFPDPRDLPTAEHPSRLAPQPSQTPGTRNPEAKGGPLT